MWVTSSTSAGRTTACLRQRWLSSTSWELWRGNKGKWWRLWALSGPATHWDRRWWSTAVQGLGEQVRPGDCWGGFSQCHIIVLSDILIRLWSEIILAAVTLYFITPCVVTDHKNILHGLKREEEEVHFPTWCPFTFCSVAKSSNQKYLQVAIFLFFQQKKLSMEYSKLMMWYNNKEVRFL